MNRAGAHHLGFASYDYDATVDFYTRVLSWQIAWQDLMTAPDGTPMMMHVFFDTGDRLVCRSHVSYARNAESPEEVGNRYSIRDSAS